MPSIARLAGEWDNILVIFFDKLQFEIKISMSENSSSALKKQCFAQKTLYVYLFL
jgi:hypothetical protein